MLKFHYNEQFLLPLFTHYKRDPVSVDHLPVSVPVVQAGPSVSKSPACVCTRLVVCLYPIIMCNGRNYPHSKKYLVENRYPVASEKQTVARWCLISDCDGCHRNLMEKNDFCGERPFPLHLLLVTSCVDLLKGAGGPGQGKGLSPEEAAAQAAREKAARDAAAREQAAREADAREKAARDKAAMEAAERERAAREAAERAAREKAARDAAAREKAARDAAARDKAARDAAARDKAARDAAEAAAREKAARDAAEAAAREKAARDAAAKDAAAREAAARAARAGAGGPGGLGAPPPPGFGAGAGAGGPGGRGRLG